jgi:hypothetical protein
MIEPVFAQTKFNRSIAFSGAKIRLPLGTAADCGNPQPAEAPPARNRARGGLRPPLSAGFRAFFPEGPPLSPHVAECQAALLDSLGRKQERRSPWRTLPLVVRSGATKRCMRFYVQSAAGSACSTEFARDRFRVNATARKQGTCSVFRPLTPIPPTRPAAARSCAGLAWPLDPW